MVKIGRIFKKILQLKPAGFWPGFFVGLVYFSYVFWWFWSVHHLTLLGTGNRFIAFIIILIPFVLTILVMALFWGAFTYFIFKFLKSNMTFLAPFFCASAFVLLEYLRAWAFGILWFGRGGLLGPHWTLGNPAYLFADLDLIRQFSSYWGIYGISFVLVFIISAFLLIPYLRKRGLYWLILEISSVFLILTVANFISLKQVRGFEHKKLIISIIQTMNPIKIIYEPGEILDDFSKKTELIKVAAKNSDIIVFPENADFSKTLSLFLEPGSAQKFFSTLSGKSVLIVDSNRISETDGIKSKSVLIDSKNGFVGFYDKKLLTPGGESLPLIASIFEYISGNKLVSSRAIFSRGLEDNVLSYGDMPIELLTCSDIISPNMARKDGVEFIINSSNLAVFNGNRLIAGQLLATARYRAAENRKYLIISSNFGLSQIIDPFGNIVKSTDSDGYKILTGDIVPNQTRTWYNKLGDWPILLVSLLIFGLGLKSYHNANQNKNFS